MNLATERFPGSTQPGQTLHGDTPMAGLYSSLDAISLEQTNRLASMQSRIDNKYLVDFGQFRNFIAAVRPHYTVLEIGGIREFRYLSCYYDDNFRSYFEHHQGRRQRMKVRTREYVDGGGMKYFEVKLKGARGKTVKRRIETDAILKPRIEGAELDMLQDFYSGQYHKELHLNLRPALIVSYQRCTLVALQGGERVTVDYTLGFDSPQVEGSAKQLGQDFIIIETKSADGKGVADTALKRLKIRQSSRCSKYCIGLNLTSRVKKNNNFLASIRRARKNLLPGHFELAGGSARLGLAG